MAKAQFIGYHMIGQTKRVTAVFPLDTPDENLANATRLLYAKIGIAASRGVGHYHGPMVEPSKILWVRLATLEEAKRAADVLRWLTNPELPITISQLRAELSLCRCFLVSTTLTMQFLIPPDDDEGFELHYRAALGRISRDELHGDGQPPYDHLRNVLVATFRGLGAHIAYVWIEADPIVRPCHHPAQ